MYGMSFYCSQKEKKNYGIILWRNKDICTTSMYSCTAYHVIQYVTFWSRIIIHHMFNTPPWMLLNYLRKFSINLNLNTNLGSVRIVSLFASNILPPCSQRLFLRLNPTTPSIVTIYYYFRRKSEIFIPSKLSWTSHWLHKRNVNKTSDSDI